MKTQIILIIFSISSLLNLQAQEYVGLSMGPSYSYDIYYSLTDGITANQERTNWELAFSTDPNDNNIRINSGNPVALYEVSDEISEWENITALNSNAIQLRNSNTDWSKGAFVVNTSGGLNYGWGDYNPETHVIEGSRIFIITYGTSTKKIIINSLDAGVYNFTMSNLDGSSEENISVDVNPYSSKNFIYYSLQSKEIRDREPDSDAWDLLFTKYEEDLNNDVANPLNYSQPYFVAGVLTNGNLVAQHEGSTEDMISFSELDTTRNTNTIGYDWKEYTGTFTIVPDRAYYLADQNQASVYKIVFDSFSGQSSGNVSFSILESEQLLNLQEHNLLASELKIYPNPSSGIFFIEYPSNTTVDVLITNLRGQIISSQTIYTSSSFDLSDQEPGFYFMHILGDKINTLKKISILK